MIYFLQHCLYITEESWFNSEKEQEVFLFKSSDQLRDPLSHVSSAYQGSVPMHRVAGSIQSLSTGTTLSLYGILTESSCLF